MLDTLWLISVCGGVVYAVWWLIRNDRSAAIGDQRGLIRMLPPESGSPEPGAPAPEASARAHPKPWTKADAQRGVEGRSQASRRERGRRQ